LGAKVRNFSEFTTKDDEKLRLAAFPPPLCHWQAPSLPLADIIFATSGHYHRPWQIRLSLTANTAFINRESRFDRPVDYSQEIR
jgi:hypothetical protein